jgi:hypothetical protein
MQRALALTPAVARPPGARGLYSHEDVFDTPGGATYVQGQLTETIVHATDAGGLQLGRGINSPPYSPRGPNWSPVDTFALEHADTAALAASHRSRRFRHGRAQRSRWCLCGKG